MSGVAVRAGSAGGAAVVAAAAARCHRDGGESDRCDQCSKSESHVVSSPWGLGRLRTISERRSSRNIARASASLLHFLKYAVLEMSTEPLLNRPCGGHFENILEAIGNTPLVELPPPDAEARGPPLGQARGPQPDRLRQGPRRQVHDRRRRGARRDRAGPHAPRADLGQHRHLAGDDLPAQGLSAEGGDARQRDRGADPAAADVRRRDRLLGGRQGLERRGGARAGDGRGRRLVLHALPVRERGQPARPLRGHRAGDPRRARRGDRLRRRPRHRRDADGQRATVQGARPRDEDRRRRADAGRAGPGAALARGRLHPADHRPQPA